MVRVPRSWLPAMASGLAQSGPGGKPAMLPVRRTPVTAYTGLVTVDIGNDGVAPLAIFNGSGQAWAFCGPAGLGESWSLDQAFMSTSVGQLDPAQGFLYAGPYMTPFQPVAQYGVAANLAGGGSQFGLGGLGFATGWYMMAFWTGGTMGATAQLRVTGTKTALTP